MGIRRGSPARLYCTYLLESLGTDNDEPVYRTACNERVDQRHGLSTDKQHYDMEAR